MLAHGGIPFALKKRRAPLCITYRFVFRDCAWRTEHIRALPSRWNAVRAAPAAQNGVRWRTAHPTTRHCAHTHQALLFAPCLLSRRTAGGRDLLDSLPALSHFSRDCCSGRRRRSAREKAALLPRASHIRISARNLRAAAYAASAACRSARAAAWFSPFHRLPRGGRASPLHGRPRLPWATGTTISCHLRLCRQSRVFRNTLLRRVSR